MSKNQNTKEFNMVIAGVGGQGLITLLQIISQAALSEGYEVRTSELHGLSQRGGSVEVHIRFGEKIYSPMVSAGKADLILGLEMQEALNAGHYASQKTNFLINKIIQPIPLIKNLTEGQINAALKKISKSVKIVPAEKICQEKLQNSVVSGVYLLGLAVFKNILPLKLASIISAIKKIVPAQFLELNLKAFNLGKSDFET